MSSKPRHFPACASRDRGRETIIFAGGATGCWHGDDVSKHRLLNEEMRADGVALPTTRYPWRILWLFLVGSVGGVVLAYPYIFALYGNSLRASGKLTYGLATFISIHLLELSLIFGLASWLGLLLATKIDLRMPFLRAWLYHERIPRPGGFWSATIIGGLIVGLLNVAVLNFYLIPRVPAWPSEARLPFWERALASFYAGVNEELLMRLFALSLLIWLVEKIARRSARSSSAVFWSANVIAIVLLTFLFLPTTAALVPLTREIIIAVVGVNGIGGLVFGYLCWYRGLESAMLAHFICDLALHSFAPFFSLR